MDTKSIILITGATGYIGRMLAEDILQDETAREKTAAIVLPVRDVSKAKRIFAKHMQQSAVEIVLAETTLENLDIKHLPMPVDYIFHCAAVTKSAEMAACPVEVLNGIVQGTRNVLEIARNKRIKSMVYLSSMEVYGRIKSNGRVGEEESGNVDLFSARSCYPLGKRLAEHYCYDYFKEYGVPVKIARLAQTFGKGVDAADQRVFAQFARAVIEKKDIVLHTPGESFGNYCGIEDTVRALRLILKKGQNGEAYNVVNEENTMRIKEMAQLVAGKIAEDSIRVIYDIPKDNIYGYAADTGLRMSSEKLCALGWKPTKGMEDMYRDLIEHYREELRSNATTDL